LFGTTFSTVEVAVKYRTANTAGFSDVLVSICDSLGNSSSSSTGASSSWTVGSESNNSWTNWDNDNLRAVVTFQGRTSTAAASGLAIAEVEWFAIGLTA
jgi:hypothetical protein